MNIEDARECIIKDLKAGLEREKSQDLFAAHVTVDMKLAYFSHKESIIKEAAEGFCDNQLWFKQRLDFA